MIYALVSDFDADTSADQDRLVVSLGVSHKFGFGLGSGGYK